MSSSPFIAPQVKHYMKKHNIEELINKTVNSMLKELPEDPYGYVIAQMEKVRLFGIQRASIDGVFIDVEGWESFSGQGFVCLKLKFKVEFMSQEIGVAVGPLGILSDQNMLYDEDRINGKGMHKGLKFLHEKLSGNIRGMRFSEQGKLDWKLQNSLHENNNLGIYQVNCLSFSIKLLESQLLRKPLHEIYAKSVGNNNKKMRMMVSCLQGGKTVGSKCKMFKYYIVGKQQNMKQVYLVQQILAAVRKTIVSGKGGEAALKISPDGTFVCPLDSILENLKIVQDAINSCNAKEYFSIGLSFQADSFYSPQTKKYELQNPKTPFDNDQMIDYVMKLLSQRPIIGYVQDPLAPGQKTAWKKLLNKIRQTETTKLVKIGSRNGKLVQLVDLNLKQKIVDLSIEQTSENHPESNEETRKLANANKFVIDFVQVRLFELKTVSNLLNAWKQLRVAKTQLMLQDCAYETYDTSLIDISYGLGCYACLGSINKFDRVCKLNRVQQIIDGKQ